MLYAVYGSRNVDGDKIQWANVGFTERTLEERLSDPDYRLKAAFNKGAYQPVMTVGDARWVGR